jgi:hypothetical protein
MKFSKTLNQTNFKTTLLNLEGVVLACFEGSKKENNSFSFLDFKEYLIENNLQYLF